MKVIHHIDGDPNNNTLSNLRWHEMKPALTPEEWGRYGLSGAKTLPMENRWGLAAMALLGQPYGFTRADVKLLRAIRFVPGLGFDPEEVEALHDLADRIEALLPPA